MVKFMSDARQQLLTLLSHQSFRLGQFKLSSGGTSDYYIDCRATPLHDAGACLTGRALLVVRKGVRSGELSMGLAGAAKFDLAIGGCGIWSCCIWPCARRGSRLNAAAL
mgnify:CR=1 FL=1